MNIITLLVGLGVGGAVMGLGIVIYELLFRRRNALVESGGYPLEAQIEDAILPYIYTAINAAYKTSEKAIDESQKRMKGVDKAAIAKRVYGLLPPHIGPFKTSFIKRYVPENRFVDLIEIALGEADAFIDQHQGTFETLYDQWIIDNGQLTMGD